MNNLTEIDNKDLLETAITYKPIDTTNYDNNQSNYDVSQTSSDILKAAETGFINGLVNSNLALRPKLLINDYSKGSKVLSDIVSELSKCDEFMISVAFITSSGITPLLETLKFLKAKGIRGKILTTDYLNFSEPKALKKLLDFSNLSIKVYSKDNFHTKGYIFRQKEHYKLIVGSSNLTQTALTKNKEWNMIVHREQIAKQAMNSFQNVFGDTIEMGILSGNSKNVNKSFLFSTIQTLSKDEILYSFEKTEFDYIIIDEVHRAGSATYQKIVSYFEPKFLLEYKSPVISPHNTIRSMSSLPLMKSTILFNTSNLP